MEAVLRKEFHFEAAHLLPNVPKGHKCERLHGHSYRITIEVRGEVDPKSGWIIDYQEIANAFEPIRLQLDHYYLNDIEGLENPTSEVLAAWIYDAIYKSLPGLACVTVHETCTSSCSYYGLGN